MILSAFSKYLQKNNELIIHNSVTATELLCKWIKFIIHKNPKNHVEHIIHREILFAENRIGNFMITGKSESGRILLNALNKFAISYENYIMSKWLANKKTILLQHNLDNKKLP